MGDSINKELLNELHDRTFRILNRESILIDIRRVRVIKVTHMKAEYGDGFILSESMTTGDGLIFDSGIPMWANEIDFIKMLKIKTFTAGLNLKDKYIGGVSKNMLSFRLRNATIEDLNGEIMFSESVINEVDFTTIVTEYNFMLFIMFTLKDSIDKCVKFTGM